MNEAEKSPAPARIGGMPPGSTVVAAGQTIVRVNALPPRFAGRRWRGIFGVGMLAGWVLVGSRMGYAAEKGAIVEALHRRESAGDFSRAEAGWKERASTESASPGERREAEFEAERLRRIRRDFRRTREQLWELIREAVRDVTRAEFDRWVEEGRFDRRWIDGEERFFVSGPSNLFFRYPGLEARRVRSKSGGSVPIAHWEMTRAIVGAARDLGRPVVLSRRFRVRMRVTMEPGTAQAGETAKAWLPVPRRYVHQDGFALLGSVPRGGQVAALLFMTLCRWSGIPARWMSGWSIFPGDETIHDWCEIHLEPWGWVPVDPYMGIYATRYTPALDRRQREELKDFYFGGLDPYRMAANADHQQELRPEKTSIRSDPVDFQRGEIEVGGRNVYFDRFDYDLKWEEIQER